ncbi:MAG TPA: acyltransferase family protein [Solirubrobacteraceae bacterium]|nr:acyltransferase family protein [Solirubrobacteraceae bacterium]
MPEPLAPRQRYMPGLDGLRAVAVLAVVAYHLGFSWAGGGLLGVGVFFTLSGYLISDILLAQLQRGSIQLGRFWLGRARRLLPALFAMLAIVAIWVALLGPAQPAQFGEAIGAAVLYVANWQLVFQHVSYFARFGPLSPLGHLWSLGVEEQFYVLWPLLLAIGASLLRERHTPSGVRPRLALATLLLAAGSAVEMALLYKPSLDPSRVYYGTDTRAFELLAGAVLAMLWPSARLRSEIAPRARWLLDGAGAAALLAVLAMVWRTGEYTPFLYRGGFAALSLASACAVAVLVHPGCRLGHVLGVAPLRWIGERSYGIYLWHVPIIALSTPSGAHGVDLARGAAQLAATIAVATLSWRFLEQPVRHGALGRMWTRLRGARWRPLAVPLRDRATLGIAVGLLTAAAVALLAWHPERESLAFPSGDPRNSALVSPVSRSFTAAAQRAAAAASTRSACHTVVHIGDSTSEGLVSPDYLPDPAQRIEAQYGRVGATDQHYEISGARSIVERYEDQPNAYEVAQRWKRAGYHGCWVLALGTNDTADVYVGSSVGRLTRIERMMSLIGGEPVMWVNVKSLLPSGPYAEQNMRLWDQALMQACARYPDMRVFDWAALAKDRWFIGDGIHYNTPGYAARSRLIAQALAHAFPASGARSGCVVR